MGSGGERWEISLKHNLHPQIGNHVTKDTNHFRANNMEQSCMCLKVPPGHGLNRHWWGNVSLCSLPHGMKPLVQPFFYVSPGSTNTRLQSWLTHVDPPSSPVKLTHFQTGLVTDEHRPGSHLPPPPPPSHADRPTAAQSHTS